MEAQRSHAITYEVFKTLNDLNQNPKFGNKSLRSFGAQIWNALLEDMEYTF